MRRLELAAILFLIFLTFITRFYKIGSPVADWHSWRQVDTSSVSRNFVEKGFDLLHPTYHDLSNIPSGKDNPMGYRFVEFPLFNIVQAGLYNISNFGTIEAWGRLTSVLASVSAVIFIYLIVRRYEKFYEAFFTSFYYAVIPFSVYYGRAILPEQAMVASILGGIYFFDISLNQESIKKMYLWLFIAFVFIASAILIKPYALLFTLPIFYISWKKYGFKLLFHWKLWLMAFFCLLPFALWRLWMLQYPEGIPVSNWLFNGGDIRFKGAFFYWIFADRISRLILGYWGVAILIIGILSCSVKDNIKKSGLFFYTFLTSSLLYLFVIARGNVQHDYYQTLIIPTISIFLGIGSARLIYLPKDLGNRNLSRLIWLFITAFTLGFGWYFIRDYYNINNSSIITAGQAADKILPKNAKVIAPYEGDTTFLYHTKRSGWPSFQNPIPELINKGATHLILLNPTENNYEFARIYPVVSESKEYIIFKLR